MNEGITLVVGLGNNGTEHARQRHNVGFWYVDEIAQKFGATFERAPKQKGTTCQVTIGTECVRLFKAGGYMNHSGRDLSAFVRFYKIPPERILLAYDELDFPVGEARLRFGGGAAGHNGVRDVMRNVGGEFWRLRVGIDRPHHKSQVVSYVLSAPSPADEEHIVRSLDAAIDVLGDCVAGRFDQAMTQLHTATAGGGANGV